MFSSFSSSFFVAVIAKERGTKSLDNLIFWSICEQAKINEKNVYFDTIWRIKKSDTKCEEEENILKLYHARAYFIESIFVCIMWVLWLES